MPLIPDTDSAHVAQPQTEGAWHIHCALVLYASEHPEAAANTYFQTAMQEALAGYRFAMNAE